MRGRACRTAACEAQDMQHCGYAARLACEAVGAIAGAGPMRGRGDAGGAIPGGGNAERRRCGAVAMRGGQWRCGAGRCSTVAMRAVAMRGGAMLDGGDAGGGDAGRCACGAVGMGAVPVEFFAN
ncbi:hypothetical protein B2K_38475 [Paenibacillus mucilaginosus K02]|uniref:Uncharacterized protein n=1 Tax=Paenibacillus mucilaginosus K02 TaxID=997761 RepID=R9UL52_9BACL|nr:hypothetical protein B2K_38475 [Paenibacillus mucilaginosus K02]